MIVTTSGKIYLSAFKTNQTKGALGPGRGRVLTSSSRTWPYPPKSSRTWPKSTPPPPPPPPVCLHTPSSSCGFCQTASFGMRPQADSVPTLLIEKSKYLAEVNRAEMRSLTFLQERSHNTSIRRMSDRAGRATLFHKFFFYSHFSALSSLSSSIDQIMTS